MEETPGSEVSRQPAAAQRVIFVRRPPGGLYPIPYFDFMTVDELKREVAERMHWSRDQQCLRFTGRVLEDGCFLSRYGVAEDSIVHLSTRVAPSNQKIKSV